MPHSMRLCDECLRNPSPQCAMADHGGAEVIQHEHSQTKAERYRMDSAERPEIVNRARDQRQENGNDYHGAVRFEQRDVANEMGRKRTDRSTSRSLL